MANFEFDGEKYRQASKHQKEWGDKLIAELNLQGDEQVLDLGCGDGTLTQKIASLLPNGSVIGVDASMGMIQAAQQLQQPNLSFVHMDINDIAYENRFDVIFSNAALHWIKNHKLLFENCLRALKAGGKIAWNFAADGTCTTFNETVKEVMNVPLYKGYFEGFEWPWFMPSEDEYRILLENSGLSNFELRYENVDRYFANSDEMIKWIDQPCIVPFLKVLPDDKKEGFRNLVVEMMKDRTKQPDGTCFETFRRINVKAIK